MTDGERTVGEQAVIDEVAADRGEEFAEEHAGLIIVQAELAGDERVTDTAHE